MYSPPQRGRLIHYWNKQNEQCLAKICMGTVNISIYHVSCACVMKKLKHGPVLKYYVCTISSGVGWQLKGLFTNLSEKQKENPRCVNYGVN